MSLKPPPVGLALPMSDVPLQRSLADDRGHVVPARVQTFGMILFLITLTMLFGSTMLLYVILRLRAV